MSNLEKYFEQFRKNIVGIDATYKTIYGEQKLIYADWIASGRLYRPIEEKMLHLFGPMVANTHTESSFTGKFMTEAYHYALKEIKRHVNAGPEDVIVTSGFGMTSSINKFQRILGLKNKSFVFKNPKERPVVFVTHMEHHSNQTSWYETIAEVVVVEPDKDLLVSPQKLRETLERYNDRPMKIGSFSACSNVTGIKTPYHELAKIMHGAGGLCFVDFAASAPYVKIDMHPADPMERLDAIFFSPHKFLGGPGASGVLIFNSNLYKNRVPDQPGGGTVDWTNPWGEYKYIDDIERREDGGTPGFLQAIRSALAIRLKEQMGVENIEKREEELVHLALERLSKIKGLHILADNCLNRIGAISFYIDNLHYNLIVTLLSERYGIQMRGGCVCAGTYGHFLLNVSKEQSHRITDLINKGDLSEKPGWVRWSLHPTTTNAEVEYIANALAEIVAYGKEWQNEYSYCKHTNEFCNKNPEAAMLWKNVEEHFQF
ncbi:aminotransferase class V-fold PLP-dependent enzyme [Tenuifilum sp.]|uniref:aminotransferase class V-fold PLP-dependent enzyme n=1 Tax=Tenuifilum sp. TaxID=2760880 RepID=UPI001B6986C4|nr:aminotransferase class V-fold PLP-dependent enzyme [Bacteroidales bacterium]HOK60685.1 aminotransferase class V-fold PLP-dependent enzyme [Tenuifilum sp.]HOK84918.1 aminotransferase class V-fold PLP-dependent enzyme [Tenuifilum sp.]HON69816.1 aminotransferase class V-fold PLP-dependent enzyme [Tenuifilum sp.]HPP89347.1 aminotransferase class V-fold PLP-dependent enzyme [Tenuifilum sp.]